MGGPFGCLRKLCSGILVRSVNDSGGRGDGAEEEEYEAKLKFWRLKCPKGRPVPLKKKIFDIFIIFDNGN